MKTTTTTKQTDSMMTPNIAERSVSAVEREALRTKLYRELLSAQMRSAQAKAAVEASELALRVAQDNLDDWEEADPMNIPVFYTSIVFVAHAEQSMTLARLCRRAQAMGFELTTFAGWDQNESHKSQRVRQNRDRMLEILGDDADLIRFEHYAVAQ